MKNLKIGIICLLNKEVFVGNDEELNKFVIDLDAYIELRLSFAMFNSKKKYFGNLYRNYNKTGCDQLKEENAFCDSSSVLGLITGSCGFPVYYIILSQGVKSYLFCISFGERNKGIFSVFLESFCELFIIK